METCINPPELVDGQLLTYLDGEAEPNVLEHLATCGYCRGRAQALAGFQNGLSKKLRRVACPDSFELSQFQIGRLRGAERQKVADHIAICPHCRRELVQSAAFFEATREPRPAQPGGLERVKVLIADLIGGGPSRMTPAAVGLRGEDDGPLIFEAGGIRIAVQSRPVTGKPGQRALLGLITGQAAAGWGTMLWRDGKQIAGTQVDDLGNFRLERIAPGEYELIIAGDELEIHLQTVRVD